MCLVSGLRELAHSALLYLLGCSAYVTPRSELRMIVTRAPQNEVVGALLTFLHKMKRVRAFLHWLARLLLGVSCLWAPDRSLHAGEGHAAALACGGRARLRARLAERL